MKIADPMKSSRRISVIAVLACAVVAACAVAADAVKNVDKVVAQEESARKARIDEMMKLAEQAKAAQKAGRYEEADQLLKKLDKQLAEVQGSYAADARKQNKSGVEDLKDAWSGALMEQAKAAAKPELKKYEESIALATKAASVDSRRASEVSKFKEWCQEKIADRDYCTATNINDFDPKYKTDREKIKSLYYQATVLFNNERYEEAMRKLEEIYVIDPLNIKASSLLDRVYTKIFTSATRRTRAQRYAVTAAGTWIWTLPIKGESAEPIRQAEVKKNGNALLERMENIVFPQVEFETDVLSALLYLQRNSKRYDPTEQGVTIIPQLKVNKAAKADGVAPAGDADNKVESTDLPKVSMSFNNIPMIDVIRYLCQDTGMGYRIDSNAVVIGYGVEGADMQKRDFQVSNTLYNTIIGGDGAAAAGDAAAAPAAGGALTTGNAGGETAAAAASGDSAKLKEYFSKRGIDFGDGSTISYNSLTGKLTMRNTLVNLGRMEDLIRQLSVIATPLIMTEIKMVKITETDLNQLGFRWSMAGSSSGYPNGNTYGITATTANSIRNGSTLNDLMESFPSNTTFIDNWEIFPNLIHSTDFNLSFSVDALSQHNSAEVLSAPKLISTSGVEASIKMVDRTRYPESWDAPEITTNGDNNATVSMPLPEFGDYTDTGIELRLTPSVNPDNYTIKLELHPKVTTAVRGTEGAQSDNTYAVKIDRGYYDDTGKKISYSDYPQYYYVWIPEFDEQSIDVTMKVFDGETVVFGGITSGTTRRVEDKMPFLGDIPFIGRLFASKSEQNIKTNLLFFVTARLINSDGLPMNRTENRGVPQFN